MSPDDPPLDPDDATRVAPGSSRVDSAVTSSSGWLSSSGEIDHGRFPPGTLLGGRYRIAGQLGRGGMGEVYRADDLKLGQPVALKFLRPDVERDPARLTQLHNEVRLARQVSHPNVCRVYDVDEEDGHTFLSMEYVDGEELASLLRRVGRFSPDRALELSRQICAGLAAAHERGVVHRDLKPSNVMLDGTGKVRITDFGLAGVTGQSVNAGTPAYMAPEQLAGSEVTAQSDIYALGLVLYELFTGQRAIEAKNVAELLRKREAGIVPPSQVVPDLDPAIDRAILRCLERDPADRPSSALGVAAALPGGDPLAAALAAGETPSPEMVAASGSASALAPAPAIAALSMALLALVAIAAMSDRVLLTSYVPFDKSPDVLADRAREVSRALGYQDTPADTAWGFAPADDYLRFARERGDGGAIRERLRTGQPAGLLFWHRESPRDLVPVGSEERVEFDNPPLTISGMRTVVVDTQGRLTEFHAVAPQRESPEPATAATNWSQLFSLAGLDPSKFSRVAPQWTSTGHSDERAAWEGSTPGWPEQPLRLEAAAYKGRVVYFQTIYPWTEAGRMQETAVSPGRRWGQAVVGLALVTVLGAAGLIARHNVRKGRGDRRGAFRIAAVVFTISLACWVAGADHFASVNTEVGRFFDALGAALVGAGLLWVLYLALEPYVRKFWPKTLVSWSRLVAGNALDPRVGRDVLLGTLFGLTAVLLGRLEAQIRPALGFPQMPPQAPAAEALEGTRQMLTIVAQLGFGAVFNALWILFGLVAINLIVRRIWISAVVMTLFLGLTSLDSVLEAPPIWFSAMFALLSVASIVFITLRFGLLSTSALFFVIFAMAIVPITLDTSRWFFSIGATLLLLLAALSIYGFYASRGGEPLLGRRILE